MKAYTVRDERDYDTGSMVIFAETPGKAKAYALTQEPFDFSEFKDLSARRCPEMDEMHKGRRAMDWNEDEDRIALVKAGWYCIEGTDDYCDWCAAKEYCSEWEEEQEEALEELGDDYDTDEMPFPEVMK